MMMLPEQREARRGQPGGSGGDGELRNDSVANSLYPAESYDHELLEHYRKDARRATDDRLRECVAEVDHEFWLADACQIRHSTPYLETLKAERQACRDELEYRRRRGYVYRRPSHGFSRELLDAIKLRVDLVAEIDRTVHLRPAGKTFVGDCPFHESKSRSSFNVYGGDDSHYHCYGCGAHGDIFDWLRSHFSWSFHEAVEYAAAIANVELPALKRGRRSITLNPQAVRYAR